MTPYITIDHTRTMRLFQMGWKDGRTINIQRASLEGKKFVRLTGGAEDGGGILDSGFCDLDPVARRRAKRSVWWSQPVNR